MAVSWRKSFKPGLQPTRFSLSLHQGVALSSALKILLKLDDRTMMWVMFLLWFGGRASIPPPLSQLHVQSEM